MVFILWFISISADGSFVAFASLASNLVEDDTNGASDVFVHERQTETTPPSDCIAPTSTHTVSPPPNAAGWNNSNATITLSAQDNEGGSGVKEIRYRTTGAQSMTFDAPYNPLRPPVISTQGTTTISYFAIDKLGNRESPARP